MDIVSALKTSDGRLFPASDAAAAEAHQAEIDFDAWYDADHTLFGNYAGSCVEVSTLKNWLREHRAEVATFLGLKA